MARLLSNKQNNNFEINPIYKVYFRFLFVFKEIITLAIAKRNHGGGRDGGFRWGGNVKEFGS